MPLDAFEGKYILLVNVASACGYTPQYSQLVEMYNTFKEQVVVIGVPCNDFGAQEPGSADEIHQFCSTNYGVTFPMTQKMKIRGANKDALFSFTGSSVENGFEDVQIAWNFHKCIFDHSGQMIGSFPSSVEPFSDDILQLLGIDL